MQNDIINDCRNSEIVNGIIEIFKENLLYAFKATKTKEKAHIIKALPYIYRMWYFSSLIDNTLFTPANVINMELEKIKEENSIVIPLVNPKFENRILKNFQIDFLSCSIENHPVVTDFRVFLELCSPDIEIGEDGLLVDAEKEKLISKLSFKEIYYITFLNNIAYELKLLKKMPSINTYRAMSESENIDAFLKLSSEGQLDQIVEATINSAAKVLCELFPVDKNTFSSAALKQLFKDGNDLNLYLDSIYSKYGLNIEELQIGDVEFEDLKDLSNVDISEETLSAIVLRMELTFYMDAYLLTPLGYYLGLIQPIYIEHFNFQLYFHQLIEAANANVPLIKLYFFMPNGFDLTALGKKLLLKGKKPKHEYQKINEDFDCKDLLKEMTHHNSIGSDLDIKERKTKNVDKNMIYSFKVKYFGNKRCWKTISIKGTQTLDHLAKAIIEFFDLETDHMYAFFLNNIAYDENYEIACPFPFDKKENTTKYKIFDLELMLKQKILFINDFGADIRFEVEFIDIEPIEKEVKYPKLKNFSKL